MSSSTWRVLKGYAIYQRTPVRIISCGKWAPLKLTAIASPPSVFTLSHRGRSYLKRALSTCCPSTGSTNMQVHDCLGCHPYAAVEGLVMSCQVWNLVLIS